MKGPAGRFARSIFFKLVLVFVATAVVMALAVSGIVRYASDGRPYRLLIGKNMAQYATYLAEEIGRPPDLSKARRLSEQLRFGLRITTPDLRWSSLAPPPASARRGLEPVEGFPNARGSRRRGRIVMEIDEPGLNYLFVFGGSGRNLDRPDGELILLIALVVGVVLALSYGAVRWLFRPLGWLTRGMRDMGRGELDTRIPVRKHDELGELAATFNDMSVKIRDLVRAQQQLLLDVSHELRSPLTRIRLAAEFIGDDGVRRRIAADVDEMEAMIGEMLESERLSSAQGGLSLEEVDLSVLAEEVVSGYGDGPPGVELAAPGPAPVRVDPERTRTLLRNLIDNAVKYSGEQRRPVRVGVDGGPDEVTVTVEDFGEGIPAEDLPLVFEPFYRVDKSRQRRSGGYGLGLSLCRKIVQAHGGAIEVESEVGKGTRFVATFPR